MGPVMRRSARVAVMRRSSQASSWLARSRPSMRQMTAMEPAGSRWWPARDAQGSELAAGLAFGVLEVDDQDADGVDLVAGEGVDAGGGLDGDLAEQGGLPVAFAGGEDEPVLAFEERRG
jgi:hypothetical protein